MNERTNERMTVSGAGERLVGAGVIKVASWSRQAFRFILGSWMKSPLGG